MNTVTSHQDAKFFEDSLSKRKKAQEFYRLYMQDKSILFRHSVSINIFFVFVIPVTLALSFSSLKPFTLSILSFFTYVILSAKRSNEIEKSFQKEFPNDALMIFPK